MYRVVPIRWYQTFVYRDRPSCQRDVRKIPKTNLSVSLDQVMVGSNIGGLSTSQTCWYQRHTRYPMEKTAELHMYCMHGRVGKFIIHLLLLTVKTAGLTVDYPSVHAMRRIVEQNFHPRIFISKHCQRVPVYAPKHSDPHIGLDRSLR
jgi:hypothetical protein